MDYEQKYKEALDLARTYHGGYIMQGNNGGADILEDIFSELKESEGERIRKTLIELVRCNERSGYFSLNNIETSSMIAWLEKQKEPEDSGEISDGYHTFNELYKYRMLYNAAFFNLLPKDIVHKSKRHHDGEECFGGGWFVVMANLPTGQISNHYELKDWDLFQIPEKEIADEWDGHTPEKAAERLHKYLIERQSEQKPADKVEPKFHEGDWVVWDNKVPCHIDNIYQGKESLMYTITDTNNMTRSYSVKGFDNNARLWTIQDAKDGDVLLEEETGEPFIYNGNRAIYFSGYFLGAHCGISNGEFNPLGNNHHWGINSCPATKEQRELLFAKMRESGYEWDSEKKELKKIESKKLDADLVSWLRNNSEKILGIRPSYCTRERY